MGETLLIRADANPQIGMGHVMRCLAIAQVWLSNYGRVIYLSSESSFPPSGHYDSTGVERLPLEAAPGSSSDAARLCQIAAMLPGVRVIIDGYKFQQSYQDYLNLRNLFFFVIDDNGFDYATSARAVLNQNLHASRELYPSVSTETTLLLGPQYALLRKEFWPNHTNNAKPTQRIARRILVTFGGSDPVNATSEALRTLHLLDDPELYVRVLIGTANKHRAEIESLAKSAPFSCETIFGCETVAAHMQWADMAISAAGSTVWELARMGVPACVTSIADNQMAIAASLEDRGMAINLGWHADIDKHDAAAAIHSLIIDYPRRCYMQEVSCSLVDGTGAKRVAAFLHSWRDQQTLAAD